WANACIAVPYCNVSAAPLPTVRELYKAMSAGLLHLGRVRKLVARLACCLAAKYGRERARQRRVPELESARLGLVREHALTAEQEFVREIAGEVMQQHRRDTEQRRPMQRPCKLAREFRVANRRGRRRVDRAGECWRRGDVRDEADKIVALDPRHPLPP